MTSAAHAPGHTDLMVSPESIDAFMEANPLPPAKAEAGPMTAIIASNRYRCADCMGLFNRLAAEAEADSRDLQHLRELNADMLAALQIAKRWADPDRVAWEAICAAIAKAEAAQ